MRWPEPFLQDWWWPQSEPCLHTWALLGPGLWDRSWALYLRWSQWPPWDSDTLFTPRGPASTTKVVYTLRPRLCILYKLPPCESCNLSGLHSTSASPVGAATPRGWVLSMGRIESPHYWTRGAWARFLWVTPWKGAKGGSLLFHPRWPRESDLLGLILPLNTHAFSFSPKLSCSTSSFWGWGCNSLLPGKLSEWHFPYKQEECVWSPLKCAGVDRGCESVEASD